MAIDDKNMDFRRENDDFEWTKEPPQSDENTDPEEYLFDTELDDRITAALGGVDLLDGQGYDEPFVEYAPRFQRDIGRGKHEAPETAKPAAKGPDGHKSAATRSDADEKDGQPDGERDEEPAAMDPNDPRYAAPERPRVVAQTPRPKVYVTPDGYDRYSAANPAPPVRRRSGGEALKWVAVALITIALLGAASVYLLGRSGSGTSNRTAESEKLLTDVIQDSTASPAPTSTPASTAAAKASYIITVTAGTGGRISPNGAVSVESGGTVTFTITPNAGYELSELKIDGNTVESSSRYTFSNVTGDHTIYAVFRAAEATPQPTQTAAPTPTPVPAPVVTAEPTPTPTPTEAPTPSPAPEPTEDAPPTPEPEYEEQGWDDEIFQDEDAGG